MEDVLFARHVVSELADVDVGFLAHHEQGDSMVSLDIIKVVHVGSHKLENEHTVISFVDVAFLNSNKRSFLLLRPLQFLQNLLHVLGLSDGLSNVFEFDINIIDVWVVLIFRQFSLPIKISIDINIYS